MILSAFTTPRNRLIAKKTVRVSTFGQQYVYRGIAPINKAICSSDETKVWSHENNFLFNLDKINVKNLCAKVSLLHSFMR